MHSLKAPAARYGFTILGVLTRPIFWLLEQALGQMNVLSPLAWNFIFVGTVLFLAGQLVADWVNRNSWLHQKYEMWREFGIFRCPETKPEFFSLGDTHGGQQTFIAVSVPFIFSEKKTLEGIRIRSHYYRYLASKVGRYLGSYEWKSDEYRSFLPEQRINIPIAFIPEKAGNPGVYGDKNLEGYCLSHGTAHFITIQLIARNWTQEKTVQIFMPSARPSFDPPSDVESGGRFLWFEDMQIPGETSETR